MHCLCRYVLLRLGFSRDCHLHYYIGSYMHAYAYLHLMMLASVSPHAPTHLGRLSRGIYFNDNSDGQRFGQLLWPSSGQIVKKLIRVLSIYRHAQKITKCREHHKLPRARAWLRSPALCRGPAVPFFKVVSQQPGTSRPTSWLRSSFAAVWMWRAFFSWSSGSPGQVNHSVVSSHLMGWWCVQACSAMADFSSIPLQQASRCSFILV